MCAPSGILLLPPSWGNWGFPRGALTRHSLNKAYACTHVHIHTYTHVPFTHTTHTQHTPHTHTRLTQTHTTDRANSSSNVVIRSCPPGRLRLQLHHHQLQSDRQAHTHTQHAVASIGIFMAHICTVNTPYGTSNVISKYMQTLPLSLYYKHSLSTLIALSLPPCFSSLRFPSPPP